MRVGAPFVGCVSLPLTTRNHLRHPRALLFQPRFATVTENFCHEIGLYQKQSSCFFQAVSAQNTITNNLFFNGPRAMVNFNDGFGGGHELGNNLIFNTCRESSDHGAFNSWYDPCARVVVQAQPAGRPAGRQARVARAARRLRRLLCPPTRPRLTAVCTPSVAALVLALCRLPVHAHRPGRARVHTPRQHNPAPLSFHAFMPMHLCTHRDRQPYVTTVRDGKTPSALPAYSRLHHNFIVANYAADGGCFDNDDGSSW